MALLLQSGRVTAELAVMFPVLIVR